MLKGEEKMPFSLIFEMAIRGMIFLLACHERDPCHGLGLLPWQRRRYDKRRETKCRMRWSESLWYTMQVEEEDRSCNSLVILAVHPRVFFIPMLRFPHLISRLWVHLLSHHERETLEGIQAKMDRMFLMVDCLLLECSRMSMFVTLGLLE